jgi:hypothetical protein
MKFQICAVSDRPGFSKVVATVEAASHVHAAATFFDCEADAVERTSGWGGQNGRFRTLCAHAVKGDVYVKRVVPR